MPVNIFPTPVALPSAMAIPANAEAVDSASLASFAQPTINAIASVKAETDKFTSGGTFNVGGDLFLNTPGFGKAFRVNGLEVFFNGQVKAAGSITSRKPYYEAPGTTGVNLISYLYEHVFSANGTVAPGCVWQIATDPPPGEDGWAIRFVNLDTTNIIILNDPAGVFLGNLRFSSGQIYSMSFVWNGSAWRQCDVGVRP